MVARRHARRQPRAVPHPWVPGRRAGRRHWRPLRRAGRRAGGGTWPPWGAAVLLVEPSTFLRSDTEHAHCVRPISQNPRPAHEVLKRAELFVSPGSRWRSSSRHPQKSTPHDSMRIDCGVGTLAGRTLHEPLARHCEASCNRTLIFGTVIPRSRPVPHLRARPLSSPHLTSPGKARLTRDGPFASLGEGLLATVVGSRAYPPPSRGGA